MWYTKQESIDYSRPIIASRKPDCHDGYLLVPCLKKEGDYEIAGFNWLSIKTGKYNSCCFYKTAQEAVADYESYTITNAEIKLVKQI